MFRSSKHIYAQVIDDAARPDARRRLVADKDLREKLKTGADTAAAAEVGKLLAERAIEAGVKDVVFDRGALPLSRPREGAGRRRPRRRTEFLTRLKRGVTTTISDERTDRWQENHNSANAADRDRDERDSEFVDKLVHINRVAKVVKGGRRFGFAALVVVGDQKGRVGFGHGKAREVPEAIRKATEAAKRALIRVPLREGRTLHHDVTGRHGAGKVICRAAPPGTGIIAGGPMRAVFETLGVQDVVAKSFGSSNPYNMVRATFDALKHEDSPRGVAARRGIKVSTLQARRRDVDAEAVEA